MQRYVVIARTVAGFALAVSSCSDSTSPMAPGPVVGIRVAWTGTYYQGVGLEPGGIVGSLTIDGATLTDSMSVFAVFPNSGS